MAVVRVLTSILFTRHPLMAVVNTELARDQGDDSVALFVLAYSWRHVVLVVECLPVARFACVWFG